MSTSAIDIETQILTRVIAPHEAGMSREVASQILKLQFTNGDRERMSELAAKARSGDLTPAERAEAEGFERVTSLLGILKSKARVSLKFASNSDE